jgi:hypothetical protein
MPEPSTGTGRALLEALRESLPLRFDDDAATVDAILAIEAEARRAALSEVEDHYPLIGQDQSDSTWLYCDCGWDESDRKSVSWFDHLEAAVAKARAKP